MPDHACLRIGGPSSEKGETARRNRKAVFHRFEVVPGCAGMEE
jgi:hypothetical protein